MPHCGPKNWGCARCGGSVQVISCIEDQDIIDKILAHLRDKEQGTPTLPHLAQPTRAPPATLSLFAGKGARYQSPLVHSSTSRDATER